MFLILSCHFHSSLFSLALSRTLPPSLAECFSCKILSHFAFAFIPFGFEFFSFFVKKKARIALVENESESELCRLQLNYVHTTFFSAWNIQRMCKKNSLRMYPITSPLPSRSHRRYLSNFIDSIFFLAIFSKWITQTRARMRSRSCTTVFH